MEWIVGVVAEVLRAKAIIGNEDSEYNLLIQRATSSCGVKSVFVGLWKEADGD
jgi:hypothetical protein